MFLKQYYLGCLSHASYMIADEKTRAAVVVDPQRDIDQYLADAEASGYQIKHVFLSHFHADFLAGHIELRNRTGAVIHLGARAEAEFDFTPAHDGDTLELGEVRLETLETPGHTPEGISLLVFDLTRSASEPHAVLTGDTLFIGDVGRPDLLASLGVTADELADMLYHSIERLKQLPDATLVYPAHGAGSMCGKNLSQETVSTIGEQKQFNYAMQPMSADQFKQIVTAEQPEAPDYFAYDAVRNRQERPDLDQQMQSSLAGLPLDEVLRQRQAGAQILDVRDAIDFEGAHLAGAINIGLHGKYATWCGSLLDHQRPIIVIAEPGDQEEAIMRLGRIGFDNVTGYLQDGMQALAQHDDLLAGIPRVTAVALADLLTSDHPPLVVDVRTADEHSAALIAGSINLPLNHLVERMGELPRDQQVVVHCAGGYRSAIAASLLAQQGLNVLDLVGGYQAWAASNLAEGEVAPTACSVPPNRG